MAVLGAILQRCCGRRRSLALCTAKYGPALAPSGLCPRCGYKPLRPPCSTKTVLILLPRVADRPRPANTGRVMAACPCNSIPSRTVLLEFIARILPGASHGPTALLPPPPLRHHPPSTPAPPNRPKKEHPLLPHPTRNHFRPLHPPNPVAAPHPAKSLELTIDGVKRQNHPSLSPAARDQGTNPRHFRLPTVTAAPPQHSANTFCLPEALARGDHGCTWRGLPTPGIITDPEGQRRNGWQKTVGDQGATATLKFFDTVLTTLKSDYKIDESRIYCNGHSNGRARFTYPPLVRPPRRLRPPSPPPREAIRDMGLPSNPSRPCTIAGREGTPPFSSPYQQRIMASVRKTNGLRSRGAPSGPPHCTLYASKNGTPFITLIYPGTHAVFPAGGPRR